MTKTKILDFHTHAFPDKVAARAIPALENAGDIQACTDGTCTGLLHSMDQAGIAKSVICSIATRVEQFQPILEWSQHIQNTRLIPFPSVHPDDPDHMQHIREIHKQGFKGIKLHPYYQDFFLAEEKMTSIYATALECELLLVVHTGFDIAFPRIRRADPVQVDKVLQQFPELRLITTHLGGWDDWQEVERVLIGRPIYLEISFALEYLKPQQAWRLLTSHPEEYLLFGTDCPWADQSRSLKQLRELELSETLFKKILWENGTALLE